MDADLLRLVRVFSVGLMAFAAGGCAFLLWRLELHKRFMPSEAPWFLMAWAIVNTFLLLIVVAASRLQRIANHSPAVWQDATGLILGLTCAGWVLYVAWVTKPSEGEE